MFFQDDEIEYTEAVMESIKEKYSKIQEKLPQIDGMLNEKAEGWNTERMGKVELAVLRIAVFEILFEEDVPNTVAINEAIEIAKKYGQEASGGFVNAVLAKFARGVAEKAGHGTARHLERRGKRPAASGHRHHDAAGGCSAGRRAHDPRHHAV